MKGGGWVAVAFFLVGGGGVVGYFAPAERGARLLANGHASAAAETLVGIPEGRRTPEVQYNLGLALFRAGRIGEASREWEAISLDRTSPGLRIRILSGLATLHAEEALRSRDGSMVLNHARRAFAAAKDALRLEPDLPSAVANLVLARRLLERRDDPNSDEFDAHGERSSSVGLRSGPAGRGTGRGGEREGAMSRERAERILDAVEGGERLRLPALGLRVATGVGSRRRTGR